jgi:diguanylate cyclase (GGDEF)-like protein
VISPIPNRPSRLRALLARLRPRRDSRFDPQDLSVAGVLDLFEEHFYVGEITSDGRYVTVAASPMILRFFGGPMPRDAEPGALWESLIVPEDWPAYMDFNRRLLRGEDGDVHYRVKGLDGITRLFWDRARPVAGPSGRARIQGIISDVTRREEADARAAEAAERFSGLLDVVGEHVYLALAHPDGRLEELFQGPGADRLLGGAIPDPEMTNWDNAIHPDDRGAYEAFNVALGEGRDSEVEYRLIGADGITRWVHDRAKARGRRDGAVEISGIVSDVTEKVRMRAELAAAHAAVSRVIEAMDDHLYTLRVTPDGGSVPVYRGPHREALVGGALPGGDEDDRVWSSLLHPDDRARWEATLERLPDGEPVEIEYRVTGLDGVDRTLLDRLRPRRDADGTLYFDGVTRDITARRTLEDELARRARTDELTGVYNRRHFTELLNAPDADLAGSALLLLDADHFKHVNDSHGHAVGDAVLVELVRRLRAELAPDEHLARWGGEEFALLLRSIDSDAELRRRAELLRVAVRAQPIIAAGATLELTVSIGAVRDGTGAFELDALVELADHALYAAKARGRDRVCLSADVRAQANRPHESERVTLARAITFATVLRADESESHSQEVADLAALIALQLALPADLVMRCRLAGWLHDAGKVAVPHAILDKPGPLDDAEWEIMRTHPVHSEAIVKRVPALRETAAAVRHHHERWDGTGYPDRLAGTDIPLEARIVAAADAYCAMTAERVYSPAKTPAQAAAELRRCAGTHLDPEVVRALLVTTGHPPALLREAA